MSVSEGLVIVCCVSYAVIASPSKHIESGGEVVPYVIFCLQYCNGVPQSDLSASFLCAER